MEKYKSWAHFNLTGDNMLISSNIFVSKPFPKLILEIVKLFQVP